MSRPRQTRPIPSKIASSTIKLRQTAKDRPASSAMVTPTQPLQSNETTGQPVESLKSTIQKLSGYCAGIEESIANKNVDQVENQLRLAYEEIARATQADLASNAAKLFQSVERLRRRMRAASDNESMSAIASHFQELFEVVTKLYSTLLKKGTLQDATRLDIVSASLETYISLSKRRIRVQDPETYDDAYQRLENAFTLVNEFYVEFGVNVAKERTLDLWRCLSGAFWNLGSALYQAGRWDHAVPYISQSVDIDKVLLATGWNSTESMNHNWTVFFEQMPKRAMLLATCFVKMNNRQRAYELYRSALSCYLQTMAVELEEHALKVPSSAVFSAPKYLSIIANVEKVTYIGALELFLGKEVDLSSLAASLGLSPLLCGALVEQQIRSLEKKFWKPEVRPIITHLLRNAANVYSTSHPLRRARLLCIHLEYAYYDKYSWEEAKSIGDIAVGLLGNKDLQLDSPLARYQPQYLITINLWMAFHSHSNRDHESISSFAYKARDILILSIAPELASTPAKRAVTKQITRPKAIQDTKSRTRVINSTVRKTGVPRPKKGEALPQPRTALNVPKISSDPTITEAAPTLINFDCPEAFWLQIEMALNLFSALGFVELKLIYLNICCMFLKTREGALERDLYAKLLIEFANECAKLGRLRIANEAFEASLQLIKKNVVNDQTNMLFLLRFASFLAVSGNTAKGLELYAEAAELSRSMEWGLRDGSTLERARSRVQRYALTALACTTYSTIQIERGSSVAASRGYLQAMRIWNAAIDITQRLEPNHPPKPAERNPFDMVELVSSLPEVESPKHSKAEARTHFVQRPGPEGWHLVLARELLETQSRISEHFLNKGNPRDAEYFILQCRAMSEALGSPIHLLRSICLQTDLQMRLWHTDKSHKHLKEAQILAKRSGISLVAEVLRLEGQYNEQIGEISRAKMCFIDGQAQLRTYSGELDLSVAQNRQAVKRIHLMFIDDFFLRIEPSEVKANNDDFTLPSLLANLLSRQIWLSRDEEYATLLDNIENLPAIGDIKIQEKVLMAKLVNHVSHRRLSQEASLGSLAESAISIPLGVVGVANMERTHSQQELTDLLKSVEKYCWSVLTDLRNRGSVAHYREIILILVFSIATKTNLGDVMDDDADMAIALLDWAAAETLRRELLESIEQKLQSKDVDDMEWPVITQSNHQKSDSSRGAHASASSIFGDPDGSDIAEAAARTYWTTIRDRHKDLSLEAAVKSPRANPLPDNWSIVNIGVSDEEDSLFIARRRPNQQSLLFCIPLKRANRNEMDTAANVLTVNSAINEMNDIVESSRQSGKRAGEVAAKGRESRAEWWSERAALDQRLWELLENIEFCWLGAFKSILAPQRIVKEEDLSSIHDKFYNFFAKIAHKNEKKGTLPTHLNKDIVECFSNLSPVARDEELEDFIYFFLDVYQSTGHRVFLSELDIDETVLKLRAVLKEVHAAVKRSNIIEDEHTFLILDKRLQGIPWESIPILRGRAVSRIPSTTFLLDRLHLASVSEKSIITAKNQATDRTSVDPTKVYYLLNPEGDLKRTEETFTPWLKSMNKVGWAGIIGRHPAEFELKDALNRRDLFIYFGHGGAEQYIRGSQIRSLLRCSSTMLWGCSSGAMEEAGDFDRTGTPYNYLLGGCPSLVVNLWDVTDRDIDKFAQSVFNKLKLEPDAVRAHRQGKSNGKSVSVVRAVAEAREVCKLKYLTGAAPVVYGIPFYL